MGLKLQDKKKSEIKTSSYIVKLSGVFCGKRCIFIPKSD